MKVLWFSNTPANADDFFTSTLKGTGGWLKSLDRELQNEVELHIAFLDKGNSSFKYQNTWYYQIKKSETFLKKLIKRFIFLETNAESLNEFLKIVKIIEPDIIHIHGTELTFGEIISKTNIPTVLSIQGNITIYKHKYFSGIEKKNIRFVLDRKHIIRSLIFGNCFHLGFKFFKMQSKNEIKYFTNIKFIIGRTDWDRRITRVLSPQSVYFHNDEILRKCFYEKKWIPHLDRNNIIIQTTSGNVLYKGFETICCALNILINNGYNVEWRIAGIGQNDIIVSVVKKKLKKDFPKKGFFLLGSLTDEQLCQKLLEADIYVMPSHIENSPNNLCEAMILGIPCIATFAGGTGSLMKDKEEGILIQDGDPWSMAGAILEFLMNFNKAILYGKNARKRALLRHSNKKILTELIEIYKNIIDG